MNKMVKSLCRVVICTILMAGSAVVNLEAAGNRGRKMSRISRNKKMVKKVALSRVRSKNKRPIAKTNRRAAVKPTCRNGACARRVTVRNVKQAQQPVQPAESSSAPQVQQPVARAAVPVDELMISQTINNGCDVHVVHTNRNLVHQPAVDVLVHVRDASPQGQALEASLRAAGGTEFAAVLDTPLSAGGIKDLPSGIPAFVPGFDMTNIKQVAVINPVAATEKAKHEAYIKALKEAQENDHKTVLIRVTSSTVNLEQYRAAQSLIKTLVTYLKNNKTGFTQVRLVVDKTNFKNYINTVKETRELSYFEQAKRIIKGRFTTQR